TPTIAPPPSIPPRPTIQPPPTRAMPAPPPVGQGGVAPGATKGDDLPTADQIIAALDKDGDGQISESEAVDQLAKNFKLLDLNKDGKLSKAEIERGLRLSKLFGIKPIRPPQSYRPDAASKPTATPPK